MADDKTPDEKIAAVRLVVAQQNRKKEVSSPVASPGLLKKHLLRMRLVNNI